MTFNEINSTVKIPMIAGVLIKLGENQKQIAYQALHHQFVASSKAVQLAHEIDPDNKVGCMVMTTVGYPQTSHPLDALAAQEYLRDGTLFFFVMYNVGDIIQDIFKIIILNWILLMMI